MSIVVFATVTPKPGCTDEVAAIYLRFAPQVHAEHGCELYALHSAKEKLHLVEKWVDGDALRAHGDGDLVKALRAETAPLVEGPTEVLVLRPYPGSVGSKGAL